jgi:hypothetical protein
MKVWTFLTAAFQNWSTSRFEALSVVRGMVIECHTLHLSANQYLYPLFEFCGNGREDHCDSCYGFFKHLKNNGIIAGNIRKTTETLKSANLKALQPITFYH